MSGVILTDNDRERIEKLPLWAQHIIRILEMKLREAQAEAATMRDLRSEDGQSNVVADQYSVRPIRLPLNSPVTFGLGYRYHRNSITVRHRKPFSSSGNPRGSRESLEIYGTDRLAISPASGNIVYVSLLNTEAR